MFKEVKNTYLVLGRNRDKQQLQDWTAQYLEGLPLPVTIFSKNDKISFSLLFILLYM